MEDIFNINKVPAPDHLYSNILEKIKRKKEDVTRPQLLLVSLSLIVVFAFNGVFISQKIQGNSDKSSLEEYSETLGITTSNLLYNE